MSDFASADSYYEEETPSSLKGYEPEKRDISDYKDDEPKPVDRLLHKVPFAVVQADDRRYLVTKWIEATTYESAGIFFARNETLRLFGDGSTEQEAIEDLSGQIVHAYEFYNELEPEQATRDALEFKQLYADLLIEIGQRGGNQS